MFVFRSGGGFWAVKFDFSGDNSIVVDIKGQSFEMVDQAWELANSLIVMGIVGCADLQGTKEGHIILAWAYNVTKEEIEKIVNIFVNNVESDFYYFVTFCFVLILHTVLPKRMGNLHMPCKVIAHIQINN